MSGPEIVLTFPIDLFKSNKGEICDINDGLIDLVNGSDRLTVRVYKPKNGPPPFEKFPVKLVTYPIPPEAFTLIPAVINGPSTASKVWICLDGVRYFPNNVTMTKAIIQIYSTSSKKYLNYLESCWPTVEDNVYSPNFKSKLEVPFKKLDKTCLLVVTFYTIEESTREVKVVGSGVLPMFGDANGSSKPVLATGGFQVPLFNSNVANSKNFKKGDWMGLPRVPCCTLLVRILASSAEMLTIIPKPLPYNSDYMTMTYHSPTKADTKLYHFVHNERKQITIRDKLISLEDLIPKSARHTDKSLLSFLHSRLDEIPSIICTTDPGFVTIYDSIDYGFSIAVKKAYGLVNKGVNFVVTSFSTNPFNIGSQFTPQTLPDESIYTKSLDFNSEWKCPVWNDGYHVSLKP